MFDVIFMPPIQFYQVIFFYLNSIQSSYLIILCVNFIGERSIVIISFASLSTSSQVEESIQNCKFQMKFRRLCGIAIYLKVTLDSVRLN